MQATEDLTPAQLHARSVARHEALQRAREAMLEGKTVEAACAFCIARSRAAEAASAVPKPRLIVDNTPKE
ncbi:hypothetical protein UFOVP347_15 [uncultured Caudovirales phage]|uniref:Uncharacterized protein n=1 Tax=uncultured Caudovirales phage TaxID=2100421 RepID=A0A6J5M681_9CAUD|nr:hypothetical protein UFOVP347_15 [uncultured Caudovirales phage]